MDFLSSSTAALIFFILSFQLCAPAAQGQYILEGKLEHSDSLPPVASDFKVGKKFNPAKLPVTGSSSVIWWWVPNWLSGTWQNSGKIKRLSLKDLENGEPPQGFDSIDIKYPDAEIIGYQQDSKNAIWTCVLAPYVGRTEQGENQNISIVHSAEPVDLSEKQVVLRFVATTVIVSKARGRIVNVTQRESLQTYRPIENGRVLVQSSMKFFDSSGNAKYESKTLSQTSLMAKYHETPYLPVAAEVPTLIDLRASFDKFLKAKNLQSLLPERAPLPPVRGYRMIVP
ncbi:MAG: hypothetical protein K2X27_13925 [Candidatus Obscuribacterales bacterium]|nr:hypothetical protein [Candidatus Obscuribacterales bacterium]